MSFIRQYNRLFRIVAKDVDTSDLLDGFDFDPTDECKSTMENFQLVFRQRPGSVDVFYQQNPAVADSLLAPISSLTEFSYSCRQNNSTFQNDYLNKPPEQDVSQYYIDNLDVNGAVEVVDGMQLSSGAFVAQADATTIFNDVFYQDVDISNGATKVFIRTRFDAMTNLKEYLIESLAVNNIAKVKVDMSSLPTGSYVLTTNGGNPMQRNIFVNSELARQGPFGVVNIYLEQAQDQVPANGAEFIMGFKQQ